MYFHVWGVIDIRISRQFWPVLQGKNLFDPVHVYVIPSQTHGELHEEVRMESEIVVREMERDLKEVPRREWFPVVTGATSSFGNCKYDGKPLKYG